MFGIFKKKPEPTTTTAARRPAATHSAKPGQKVAKGTEIRYDENLIDRLQNDHKTLLQIYTEINTALDKQNFKVIAEKLAKFRVGLTDHLLTENVKLYVFLDNELASDAMNSELIRSFRREMDGIGKTVMDFLRKYQASGVNADNAVDFRKDFGKLGEVLSDRISREESTLYLLYSQIERK